MHSSNPKEIYNMSTITSTVSTYYKIYKKLEYQGIDIFTQ